MSDDSEQKVYIGSDGELSDDFETESIADILSSQDDKEKSKQKPKNTLNRQINKNLIVLFSLIFVVGMLFLNNFLKSTKSDNNDNWVPVIQEFDGVEMVLVPAGCFEMGNGDYSNERPVSKQCFDESFWIDRYEVTNEQYGSYGCREYSSQPDQPRNCVDWFDARDFCEKLGGRLPSEAEWEYAARGPDNLKYPWGNDFVADNVAYNVNSPSETANVGSYPDGMSWVGAYDLSGNLLEWTNSYSWSYPYNANDGREKDSNYRPTMNMRVLRGGSFSNPASRLRTTIRKEDYPQEGWFFYGFRCARSTL